MVGIGEQAPAFDLESNKGGQVTLTSLLAHRAPLVLFFYPKDETPGCTAEACSFRDSYEDFLAAGAQVVGISSDDLDSHQSFARRHVLPFPLLSDKDGHVRRAYGVRATLGLFPGRVTFVIDSHGTVRHVYSSQLRATAHVDEALQAIRRLTPVRAFSDD